MIKNVQDTIVNDVQDDIRHLFSDILSEQIIEEINEKIELTILNGFWKHGIRTGAKLREV
jgi:hypothetical protein